MARYEDLITFVQDRPGHDVRYAVDAAKIRRDLGWLPLKPSGLGPAKPCNGIRQQNPAANVLNGSYRLERLGTGGFQIGILTQCHPKPPQRKKRKMKRIILAGAAARASTPSRARRIQTAPPGTTNRWIYYPVGFDAGGNRYILVITAPEDNALSNACLATAAIAFPSVMPCNPVRTAWHRHLSSAKNLSATINVCLVLGDNIFTVSRLRKH